MSPKKLTGDDKQEILKLYRQTPETTSTLADRYGVSSSTISRFLKNTLSGMEYEELIQKKRLARTNKSEEEPSEVISQPTEKETKSSPVLVKKESPTAIAEKPQVSKQKPALKVQVEQTKDDDETEDDLEEVDVIALGEMLGEDLGDEDEDWEDEDDEDEEEDGNYEQSLSGEGDIQVLPLSSATFPRTCYLVIDRTAELIVRPLKEFAHLGQIPTDEFQEKTLPVFDNHRIARRFSNRSQRVIKVPDGRLLYKTCSHLYDKGITRLLMDGQIYSLSSNAETFS
ncbi:MAG: transposase [Cyanobacteria bacterium P01_G01_bin.49]